jgi:ubiquinone/menaquinone biosynthesis C-methylase UbiE
MEEVIGAHHEFHDEEFVEGWAARFVPTPKRLELFNVILSELKTQIPANGCVVELGIGPGYLADHLLSAMPDIKFYAIDFSGPMLDIARQRLRPHSVRVTYIQADLVKDNWWKYIPMPINVIVSTWALHDLGSQENIERVYRRCAQILHGSGMLLNGDFIKPDNARFEYEPGRFEIVKHIEILSRVGFKNAECLLVLEEEIESPTAAQNYACFKGLIS